MRPNRLLFAAAMLASSPAAASSTAWHDTAGGRLRLVTTGTAAGGTLRGALQIELAPGWKTYWRDPGDAGVPPTIDVSGSDNIAGLEIAFPAPQRFRDADTVWAGYERPVTLALSFAVPTPDRSSRISADVFLGICKSICIPVQESFALDPAEDADNAGDKAVVEQAFAALPAPATSGFGVTPAESGPDAIKVAAHLPAGVAADEFFLAAADGYYFAAPQANVAGGVTYFYGAGAAAPRLAPARRRPALHAGCRRQGGQRAAALSLTLSQIVAKPRSGR